MTADMQASLRKLNSLSQSLNEASDTLTASLNSVETELNKMKLGVSAFVDIRREDAGDTFTRVYSLGYYKLGGKWGLVVYEYIEGMEDEDDRGVKFLRDTPRELRIEAAEHLADLVEKLAANADKTAEKVKLRAAEAEEIASALSKGRT